MRIGAIITEFNPFHNGHSLIANEARQTFGSDCVIAIMGTYFAQRGGPYIYSPNIRSKMAVTCGYDLVLGLPYCYSAQGAEVFCRGAVNYASSLPCDFLLFGSELGHIETFKKIGGIIAHEPAGFIKQLRENLDAGQSFATSRARSLEAMTGMDMEFLSQSNNILAVEYCKAKESLESNIELFTIKRDKDMASAGYIRSIDALFGENKWFDYAKHYIPGQIHCLAAKEPRRNCNEYTNLAKYKLLIDGLGALENIAEIEDGLDHLIISKLDGLDLGIDKLAVDVSNKRYTVARAHRIIFNSLMGYTSQDLSFFKHNFPSRIQLLAYNDKGREALRFLKKMGGIEIMPNTFKKKGQLSMADERMLDFEEKARNLYMIFQNQGDSTNRQYFEKFIPELPLEVKS
ncbi:MAG: nucleotidyltransferase family protein [Eubacteriaceae bacterium]|nr:nucleotidyltransferase family protein [Eubacteriaceae bacterium]